MTNQQPRKFARLLRFRVEPCDFQQLHDLAKRTGVDPSALLRRALRLFLDQELKPP